MPSTSCKAKAFYCSLTVFVGLLSTIYFFDCANPGGRVKGNWVELNAPLLGRQDQSPEERIHDNDGKPAPFASDLDSLPAAFRAGNSQILPVATFGVIQLPHLVQTAAPFCSRNQKSCDDYNSFMQQLNAQASFLSEDVRLHVVQVDPLLWLRNSDKNHYRSLSRSIAEELTSSRAHIRFKGSDHLFVCLSQDCQTFAEEFGKLLSNDLGTRAIFAGVNIDVDTLSWPCPLRLIQLRQEELTDMSQLATKLVRQGALMIEKRYRWVCADDAHPMNHVALHQKSMSSGGMWVEEYNLFMCHIPKSGSTMTSMLVRRMMHIEDWNSTEGGLPHNPHKNGIVYMGNGRDFQLTKRIYDDQDIITAAIVRHPIARLLSGYLDKIVDRKQYSRIPKLDEYVNNKGVPTFPQFVDYLIELFPDSSTIGDVHFIAQSNHCGLRHHRTDFVARLDNLGNEFAEFAKSIGIWDDFVSTGWGKDQSHAFGEKSYEAVQHNSGSRLWQHYTPELMHKVYNYYKNDFITLGYTLEEMLETRPDDETAN